MSNSVEWIIGFDVSLNRPAFVIVGVEETDGKLEIYDLDYWVYESKKIDKGLTLTNRVRRLQRSFCASDFILNLTALEYRVNRIVYEFCPASSSFKSTHTAHLNFCLGWILGYIDEFLNQNTLCSPVHPSTLKKAWTNNGRADKSLMREAAIRLLAQNGKELPPSWKDDEVDALLLACYPYVERFTEGWF
jgi:Holliday junction resolvasome RuvABC endonuclease subunit